MREGFFLFCFAATVSGEAARSLHKNKKPSGTQGTEQGNIKQFWELREQNSVKMKTSKIEIKNVKGNHLVILSLHSRFSCAISNDCGLSLNWSKDMSYEFTLGY